MRRWRISALEVWPRVMFASRVFFFWTSSSRSSTLFSITYLIVVTGRVWPNRCYDKDNQPRGEGSGERGIYNAVDGLVLDGGVPVRVHEVYALSGGQIEPDATGLQTDEKDLACWIVLQRVHRAYSFLTLHGPV